MPSSLPNSTRAVLKLFGRFHADFQLGLCHDADWPLVRMSPVFGANVTRIPIQLLGSHQRVTGIFIFAFFDVAVWGVCQYIRQYLQPDLHHVFGGPLVGLHSISCTYAKWLPR